MATATIDLLDTIQLIPGYDPVATAGDCVFDEQAAQLALDFFPEMLKHVKGALAGQPFHLGPWQAAIIANIFGWKRPDGSRRYREAFIFVPRKNGKTTLGAGIVCYVLFCDDEPGAENYSAAATRQQAGHVFDQAVGMIRQEPELLSRCRIYGGGPAGQARTIALKDLRMMTSYKVLAADAKTQHGANAHLVVVDELHAQPNRELIDVLETSMGSRRQPLILHITTADYDRESICNEKRAYAIKVRDGILDNPAFLPVIYEAGLEDDWRDPDVWAAANPCLGVSLYPDYLKAECRKAQDDPLRENMFKRLHLNITTSSQTALIPMDQWDACPSELDMADLAGKPCWGGLDLASTIDTNALVLFFPHALALLCYAWVPRMNADERELRDAMPYQAWARQGHLRFTPGNTSDQEFVLRDVLEIAKDYNIKTLGYDSWGAQWISQKLAGEGLEVVKFVQGFKSFSGPTKELLKLVRAGTLNHGGNPLLRAQAACAAGEDDAADGIKPTKKGSSDRIDLIVAAIMAIGCAQADGYEGGTTGSVYDDRGLLTV